MDKKKIQSNIIICMISAIAGAGLTLAGTSLTHDDNNTFPDSFSKLNECVNIINEEAVGTIDDDEAINGYLTASVDKYTHLVQDLYEDEDGGMTKYVNTAGTAIASGFQIGLADDGNILLTKVEEGKAAYKSGLRALDVIVKIGEKEVAKEGYENIANKLLGKQDTEVKLVIRRNGEEHTIAFKRDNVYIRDVEWEKKGDIGYIKIKSYTNMTEGYMDKAVEELDSCKGYIIDVRQNGGGDFDACIGALKHFAPGIEVRLIAEKIESEEKCVTKGDPTIDTPVVVLIDSETASASEIITSAIKQYNPKAEIVGTNTKGKGVYQKVKKLQTGDYLAYTAGKFYVGDWECWQGVGIAPDVEVEMDPALIGTDKDIQLKKALELLD